MSQLYEEASAFIRLCYRELGKSEAEMEARLEAIHDEIRQHNHYEHTSEELEFGAKAAWRNSNRCIGRLYWNTLHVVDERAASTAPEVRDALLRHISYATNNGKIRPVISIFRPARAGEQQVRIWNYQLIRYAGYETEQGIVGDPHSVPFTNHCLRLGWKSEKKPFELLPFVIQIRDERPQIFDIPREYVLEVPLRHPDIPRIADLQLKWYAVPIVSNMRLEIGGIQYTAAPFNGWYMATEVGARNLADEARYNLLPTIARCMGLDTSKPAIYWKDRALVELNLAVALSYQEAGVRMVDHHMAAQQFKQFELQEQQAGRGVTGDWTWLIPPVSPATTHIFHSQYDNTWNTPNFFYQDDLKLEDD